MQRCTGKQVQYVDKKTNTVDFIQEGGGCKVPSTISHAKVCTIYTLEPLEHYQTVLYYIFIPIA